MMDNTKQGRIDSVSKVKDFDYEFYTVNITV